MPTRLPNKPRAKAARANELDGNRARKDEPRKLNAIENIDWLALWALSLGGSALVLAGLAFFACQDAPGATAILAGTAGIIAVALYSGKAPDKRP